MRRGVLRAYSYFSAGTGLTNKERRNLMSQNAAPVKGPAAPPAEVMTLWTRVKRLGTLLSTEEVFNEDGTSKRVTRVLRAGRM
jgi:hypothetical protein